MKLPITAKPIKGAYEHWVDIDGSIYAINHRNNQPPYLYKKAQQTVYGYKYCGICYGNKIISKRVHKLVAEAFIPNPKNYKIIGHKNNIKSDNRVENLYWTTTSENTKKAYDDGLELNKKGFDDSQSLPVNMYDTKTNKLIKTFGSISLASQETGINKTTISRQAKYKRPVRKPYYFRYIDDLDAIISPNIGMFDYNTDKIINTFYSSGEASKETGVSDSTILSQCVKGKPKYKTREFYFQRINNNKCKETIEILERK